MSYKTILVHVDESSHLKTRVAVAARIALEENAHLTGIAMTGISRFLRDTVAIGADDPAIVPYLEALRQRARRVLQSFEEIARQAGVGSVESQMADDDTAAEVALRARFCDLAVIGQTDPQERLPGVAPGTPEYIVMNSRSPCLLVPYSGDLKSLPERVLIAWNASAEAMSAVRGALPLLKRARMVDVAIFNPGRRTDLYGMEPGADIALYLARHDVKVNVIKEEVGDEAFVGNALLSLAADQDSDMLVMGCYGHSRVREILLGGVTRTLLDSMTVPVLMAH